MQFFKRFVWTFGVGQSTAAENPVEHACRSQQKVAETTSEIEEIGRITKTHADFCEIAANINGTEDVLSINPRQFYAFGIRCEGDMTNILKEGMEVRFCYSVSEQKAIVTIAWLGDKPGSVVGESETENEGTGVIRKVAECRCEMRASIKGCQESLSFHRRIFYSFGIRCEGNLTNILEEGMEVEFCYSVCDSKIDVIAVWLGHKPDLKLIEDLPEAVYNEKGRVLQILDNASLIVKSDFMSDTVLVDTDVVYRDCAPNSVALAVNDDLTFDAIPLESTDEYGAKYGATCAWIGQVPRIVDRFGLNIPDDSVMRKCDLEYFQENCVDGTVAVIVNEFVAFVDVEYDGLIERVLLFRSSFHQSDHRCLQDFVSVGDRILLLVVIGSIFDGCRRLYAAKAWRNADEKKEHMAEEKVVEPERLITPINVVEVDRCVPASQDPSLLGRFNIDSKVLYPSLTGIIRPYSVKHGKKLTKGKKRRLGVISSDNSLSVVVSMDNFYVDGRACLKPDTFDSIVNSGSSVVSFEGVLNPHPCQKITLFSDKKISHVATCAWIGQRPSLKSVACRLNVATLPIFPINMYPRFTGSVFKFYLPYKAIVVVSKINKVACLHVTSFPSKSGAKYITDFVKLKQRISFQLVPDPECEISVLAVNVLQTK